MICPKCNKENLPGAIFCANCGSKLSSAQRTTDKRNNKTQMVSTPSSNYLSDSTDVVIGRGDSCDVKIDDPGVSSKHARIFVEAGRAYIEDLRSLNGTYVNGRKITSKKSIGTFDLISLGNHRLNLNNSAISRILLNYGSDDYSLSGGILQLRLNTKWFGKILFFIMIVLMFFPWLTVRASGVSVSFTAFDFAFNRFPSELDVAKVVNPEYGPLHTLFLLIFFCLALGFIMNFIKVQISEKFNFANILSIIIFVMIVGYLSLVSSVDSLFGLVSVVLQHNFASYLFIFICFISIFEAVLEFYFRNKNVR